VAACTELDAEKAAFEGQDEACNNLHFADDKVLSELHYINFKKILPHNWKTSSNVEVFKFRIQGSIKLFYFVWYELLNFFEFCNGHHAFKNIWSPSQI